MIKMAKTNPRPIHTENKNKYVYIYSKGFQW